jgi:hypothetical protein
MPSSISLSSFSPLPTHSFPSNTASLSHLVLP